MATLTIVVWILAFIMTYICFQKVSKYKGSKNALDLMFLNIPVSGLLAWGVTHDLGYKTLPDPFLLHFFEIWGPIVLAVTSLESFILPKFWGEAKKLPSNNLNLSAVSFGMEIVSFISAVLSIIAFFR